MSAFAMHALDNKVKGVYSAVVTENASKGADAMFIIAKYDSTCPTCALHIPAGQQVSWEKGQKARHVGCGTPSFGTQTQIAGHSKGRRGATRTGCSCGSVDEYEKAGDCWSCRHDR